MAQKAFFKTIKSVEQKLVGKNMKYEYIWIAKTCNFRFHAEFSISLHA